MAQSTTPSTAEDCFYEVTATFTKCANEVLQIDDLIFEEGGTYYDTIVVQGGCDTIKEFLINQLPTAEVSRTIASPPDSTVIFEGKTLATGSITPFVFKNSRGCDSIVYVIVVLERPLITPEIIEDKEICLPIDSAVAQICLPFPIEDVDNYILTLTTGTPEVVHNCDFKKIYGYQYNLLPYIGADDRYIIDQWQIDSTTHTGTVASMEELINWIELVDPKGNWKVDPINFSIVGGILTATYGDIILTKQSTGLTTHLGLNKTTVPMGTLVKVDMIGKEKEILSIEDVVNNCKHRIVIRRCP